MASSCRCPFPQRVLSILRLPGAAPGVAVQPLYPPPPRGSSFGELQSRSKGLEGDKTDSGLEFSTAAEGRHKPPPSLHKCFIAHVEGGAAAHISSMTSSWFDLQSEREGRDEELKVPLCLVCGWTMNSWVFGSTQVRTYQSSRKSQSTYHLAWSEMDASRGRA